MLPVYKQSPTPHHDIKRRANLRAVGYGDYAPILPWRPRQYHRRQHRSWICAMLIQRHRILFRQWQQSMARQHRFADAISRHAASSDVLAARVAPVSSRKGPT